MTLSRALWYNIPMNLSINFLPELAAGLMGLVLSVALKVKYENATAANVYFRHAVYGVTFVCLMDSLSVWLRAASGIPAPVWVYRVNTTIFYMATSVAIYLLLRYIVIRAGWRESLFYKLQFYLLVFDLFLLCINLFTGFVVYYEDALHVVYGPLHLPVCYGVAIWYMVMCVVVQSLSKEEYTRYQRICLASSTVSLIVCFVINFFFLRDILFTFAFGMLSLFLIYFTVEIPLFHQLSETSENLTLSKEEADKAAEQALMASRIKSNFLANTTHEIRTPMNAILGMNDMIASGTGDAHIKESAQLIANAGESLLGIINDVLDYSRIEAGRVTLNEADFCLSDALIETAFLWKERIEKKGIAFSVHVGEGISDGIYGDRDKLCQILVHLLSNAYKYTEEGSIVLDVTRERTAEKDLLCFAVKDTGAGVREEDKKEIFALFGRGSIEENRDKQGAGLGLKITDELARMMSGFVDLQSVFGEGSTFTLKMPYREGKETKKDAADEYYEKRDIKKAQMNEAPYTAKDKQILVVDDTVVNLTIAKGQLKDTLANVDTALSGIDCLNMARAKHYDLVLLDHMMPEMDGVEVLHRLRETKGYETGACVIIAMTASVDSNAAAYYKGLGFDDYLAKPMRGADLIGMIKKHLEGR